MAARRYVEAGALLLKPIAAGVGARVCRLKHVVTIDGVPAAVALKSDRLRRTLPRWSGCLVLRSDQLFLLATDRHDSFDSRYFGPVLRSDVVGRAVPVWTRP